MMNFDQLAEIDLSHKTIVITGANAGIGFECAKYFVSKQATVFLCARSLSKGQAALNSLKSLYPEAKVHLIRLDLSDFESIRTAVKDIQAKQTPIDILLNNAGIMAVPYQKTTEGFEMQMGVNHLGHFYLTHLLLASLSPQARIVNVSSMAYLQGKLDRKNMLFENGRYHPFSSYARSKLANLLFTEGLNAQFSQTGSNLLAVSAHPGVAKTSLFDADKQKGVFATIFRYFAFLLPSAQAGSRAILYACLDSNAVAGQYYGPHQSKRYDGQLIRLEKPLDHVKNKEWIDYFWAWSWQQISSVDSTVPTFAQVEQT
jgi:NAD(P)-dependent dehydrogenase (short-subunit alcohol dehydrogenase family)